MDVDVSGEKTGEGREKDREGVGEGRGTERVSGYKRVKE